MTEQITCPRCGARDSFIKGFLPATCVCRVCQSQLDYREIPGCGPDCKPAKDEVDASGATDGTTAEDLAAADSTAADTAVGTDAERHDDGVGV